MAHILVVDDDDILAEHAARVLIDAGHACGWVTDTRAAMQVIAARRPDLLLLDQNLPGENGSILLRRLRVSSRLWNLPVIMLTAATGLSDEQAAYYNGAQDYIRKPFCERTLAFRVNRIIDARRDRPRHLSLAQSVGIDKSADRPALRRI